MSRSDHSAPIESEFFAELQSRLLAEPGESLTRVQVGRTAHLASVTRSERRGQMGRAALVALSLATLISTSGVAVAGSFPAPVQGMVADVARLLPVPLPIPYPIAPATTVPADPEAPESGSLVPARPADSGPPTEDTAEPTDESSQASTDSSDDPTENTGSPLETDDRNESSQDDRDRGDDRDRDRDDGDHREDEDRDEEDDRDRDGGWNDDDERDRDENGDGDRDDDDRDRDGGDVERDRDRDEDRDRDGDNGDFRKENDRSERDDR